MIIKSRANLRRDKLCGYFSGTLPPCTQGKLARGLIIKTLLSLKGSYVNRILCFVLKTGGWQFQKSILTSDLPTTICLRRLSNL
jgi:hypothetical protein